MAHISLRKHGITWFASRIDPNDRITDWSDSTYDALALPRRRCQQIAYTYNRVIAKNGGGGTFAKIVSGQKEPAQ